MEMVCGENGLMWTHQMAVLPDDLCRRITSAAVGRGLVRFENRHFVADGKRFFTNLQGLGFLRDIMAAVQRASTILDRFGDPVVEHAFMLIKSEKAPATPLHQDRAFWGKKENEPASMLTLWFALEDIDDRRGALCLTTGGETDRIDTFNSNRYVYDHVQKHFDNSGNFGRVIQDAALPEITASLRTVCPHGGDMIIFDAYEPHASAPHDGDRARMAFKVVLGERHRLAAYLVGVDELLRQPAIVNFAKSRLARFRH